MGKATQLDNILQKREAVEAWEFFQQHYDSRDSVNLVNPPPEDLAKLGHNTVFRKLLRTVVVEWTLAEYSDGLPSPSQVIARLEEMKIMNAGAYEDTLWRIYGKLLKQGPLESNERRSGKSDNILIEEIMTVWKLLFRRFIRKSFRTSTASQEHSDGWSCLPSREHLRGRRPNGAPLSSDPSWRLWNFTENYSLRAKLHLTTTLLMTFDILTQQDLTIRLSPQQRSEFAPFVQFSAHILSNADISSLLTNLDTRLQQCELNQEDAKEILARVRDAPFRASVLSGSRSGTDTKQDRSYNPADSREQLEEFFVKRLGRVLERNDVHGLDTTWADIERAFGKPDSPSQKVDIPHRIYDFLFTTAWGMKQAERALEIWNFMVANGTKPTVRTWTAMLDGCGKSRDINALEAIWQRMLASGTRPDAHAWTARIFGLLSAGRFQEGLKALNDMGQAWIVAVQGNKTKNNKRPDVKIDLTSMGDHAQAAKPNVETLNAVVTALSRYRRTDLIPNIFNWAKGLGIKPDAVTFNILIRLTLRDNDIGEAMKLLAQMDAHALQPDVTTFTIILDSIFRSPHGGAAALPAASQTALVSATLAELEARGLAPNGWVFSTLIDGLLKRHDNLPAARAVLAHMAARAIRPSPHVYTILMTHFFAQRPPDLAAVDALWRAMGAAQAPKDLVFYDRMVEGFARAGEVGRMMVFLARMSRDGKSPGWQALKEVVAALARAGDWVRLEEVVADVERGEGIRPTGQGSGGRRAFWELVEEVRRDRVFCEDAGAVGDGEATAGVA